MDKTDETLARVNRYLESIDCRKMAKEQLGQVPCLGDPEAIDLDCGLCNPAISLPEPTEEIPRPKLCVLHPVCLELAAKALGVDGAESVPYTELVEICQSVLATPKYAEGDVGVAELPDVSLDATQVMADAMPKLPPPPLERADGTKDPIQDGDELAVRKGDVLITIGQALPPLPPGDIEVPEERPKPPDGGVQVEPSEVLVRRKKAAKREKKADEQTVRELAVATAMGEMINEIPFEIPRAIPFRKSSAAWKIWIMLLEPQTEDELLAKLKSGNYYYFKRFVAQVFSKAREMGVLSTAHDPMGVKPDTYRIMGQWDTTPGRTKRAIDCGKEGA